MCHVTWSWNCVNSVCCPMHNNVPAQLMFSTPAKFCKAMPRFCTPVLIVNPSPCSCRIYANFSVQINKFATCKDPMKNRWVCLGVRLGEKGGGGSDWISCKCSLHFIFSSPNWFGEEEQKFKSNQSTRLFLISSTADQ